MLILYRRHDSDDEVWCYRRTGEALTLVEASPRGRGRKWESARGNGERLEQGFKQGNNDGYEATRKEAWRWTRWPLTTLAHTWTHKHLWAHSKWEVGGGRWGVGFAEALHLKLWDKTWNCSCMLQSILLSSLCQRLDCVTLSQWNTRQEMRWRMK